MYSRPAPFTWTFQPATLMLLMGIMLLYALALGPLRRRLHPDSELPRSRVAYFTAGWLTLVLVYVSPLEVLGRYYWFLGNTIQLFILITATAPLLMMGLPDWLVTWLLPVRVFRDATRTLLFPVVAAVVFNAVILAWHIGPVYDRALRNSTLYDLELLCYLVAGVLTWWPVLTPMDRHTRMSSPFQMLYLMLESLPLDIFGATAIFAPGVFYSMYATAPRVLDLAAMTDQQASGAILAVPGNILDIILMSVVFFMWIRQVERAQQARESISDSLEPDSVPADTPGT